MHFFFAPMFSKFFEVLQSKKCVFSFAEEIGFLQLTKYFAYLQEGVGFLIQKEVVGIAQRHFSFTAFSSCFCSDFGYYICHSGIGIFVGF